ncbi:CaiB/BaiF CoA transferase family protein [Bacillus sp. OxB-1]|uniref:CaiB/BaiF CoA transferase family protein n=1 Tax=Bacillus sp. (strain OxB-1) TaxID=98228 RepID=UPI00059753D9|nr:CaiB/BaiF CoA-transferase family protein [Bacillus sp. OxB-1]
MSLLAGLKILDFSTLLPGPYATMMLADLGADVIRIESATRQDLVRSMPPVDGEGTSATHGHLNRSKKSMTLNLKLDESKEIIHALLQEYDIIIEQFRPGVMERLGLDYESLRQINPRLIYCSLTGFGQTGPYRNRPGHDNNFLALSGIMDYSRRKEGVPPTMGIQIADVAGGSLHSVIGILAAALHREKTGEGQYVDVSMTDTAFSLNAMYGPGYLVGKVEPKPEELMLNGGIFYDYYETADGRFFAVGSLEPQFLKLFCEALEISDSFEMALSGKVADQQSFKQKVQDIFVSKTYEEWLGIFNEDFEGCVEPVLSFAEATEHPQIQARQMVVEVPKGDGTTQRQIASPIKFSTAQPVYSHIGAGLGEHTESILLARGFTAEQIGEWKEKGVFS